MAKLVDATTKSVGVKLNVRPYAGSAVTSSNLVYGTYYAINLIISLNNFILITFFQIVLI